MQNQNMITVQQVIDFIMDPPINLQETVDGLLSGQPDMAVTGVIACHVASHKIIDKAVDTGANMIISHEGVFYSHKELTTALPDDPVFLQKMEKIRQSGIALFRDHDHIHQNGTDLVKAGLLQSLKWEEYEIDRRRYVSILEIPTMTLSDIVDHLKTCLHADYLRYQGNPTDRCVRIGAMVGYKGPGADVIPLMQTENLDLILYGESPEWEAPEYIRDAVYQGRTRDLIVLGHEVSESPGMEVMVQRISGRFPGLPVRFMRPDPLFQIG